jgi:hypothetical protein
MAKHLIPNTIIKYASTVISSVVRQILSGGRSREIWPLTGFPCQISPLRSALGSPPVEMTKAQILNIIGIIPVMTALFIAALLPGGCVKRELTVNTKPEGALVFLNDEEIGTSPVTVSFEWYGDYYVRISKPGFETLDTHRNLKAPWYDYFPFDFFAQVILPARIVDSYEWAFELAPQKEITREQLIQNAEELKKQLE